MKRNFIIFLFILFINLFAAPDYWQQKVSYHIDVKLDVTKKTLQGKEILQYWNNSPDTLNFVWLHLYPNAFKNEKTNYARESNDSFISESNVLESMLEERGYININSIKYRSNELKTYLKEDDITEMKVILSEPLVPGDSLTFDIDFFVKIPKRFQRLGYSGNHFEITQWYPKMVVYDKYGWHPDGYHATGEFYGEFGDFTVSFTIPKNMVIGGTGERIAPKKELLFIDSLANYSECLDSMSPTERTKVLKKLLKPKEPSRDYKTVTFYQNNVHTCAYIIDPSYMVKREKYNGITYEVLVRPENYTRWRDVIEWSKDAIRYYSQWYGKYPYSIITVADANIAGMEYPTFSMVKGNWDGLLQNRFELVVVHEIGHNWFYGILGSDEQNEPFMDEGFNQFSSDIRYPDEKYGKDYTIFNLPDKLRFLTPTYKNLQYSNFALMELLGKNEKMNKRAIDFDSFLTYNFYAYTKGSKIIEMLKYTVGDSTFDAIMQQYYREYKFKHPHLEDFIKISEQTSGQKLNWFFEQYFETTKQCDYAIGKVETAVEENRNVTEVEIVKKDEIIMPLEIELKTKSGEKIRKRIFADQNKTIIKFQTESKFADIQIDPDRKIIETSRQNNNYKQKYNFNLLLWNPLDNEHVNVNMLPYIWYNNLYGMKYGSMIYISKYNGNQKMHNLLLSLSYLSKPNRVNYFATYVLMKKLNNRLKISSFDRNGQKGFNAEILQRKSDRILGTPSRTISLSMNYRHIYDLDFFNINQKETGRIFNIGTKYKKYFKSLNLLKYWGFGLETGLPLVNTEFNYQKIYSEVLLDKKIGARLSLNNRIVFGYMNGEYLKQSAFWLTSINADQYMYEIEDPMWGYGNTNNMNPVSGNMIGFFDHNETGNILFSSNYEINYNVYKNIDLMGFFDIGNVYKDVSSLKPEFLNDFGIGVVYNDIFSLKVALDASNIRVDKSNYFLQIGLFPDLGF